MSEIETLPKEDDMSELDKLVDEHITATSLLVNNRLAFVRRINEQADKIQEKVIVINKLDSACGHLQADKDELVQERDELKAELAVAKEEIAKLEKLDDVNYETAMQNGWVKKSVHEELKRELAAAKRTLPEGVTNITESYAKTYMPFGIVEDVAAVLKIDKHIIPLSVKDGYFHPSYLIPRRETVAEPFKVKRSVESIAREIENFTSRTYESQAVRIGTITRMLTDFASQAKGAE